MEKGWLVVATYSSNAIIPLSKVDVYVTNDASSVLLARRETNLSGLTEKVEIEAPDIENSLSADANGKAFRAVNVYVSKAGYFNFIIKNVQIFPERTSLQIIQMIPIPANYQGDVNKVIDITPQNL